MTTDANDLRSIEHFTTLARRGKGRGASGGERHAFELAVAILEHASYLDGQAMEGAMLFLQRANLAFYEAQQLIDG